MTTKQIINQFIAGATKGKASSVHIDGDKLFNYGTVLLQKTENGLIFNATKYSMTTTKHQNVIRSLISDVIIVENVNMGCSDLLKHTR